MPTRPRLPPRKAKTAMGIASLPTSTQIEVNPSAPTLINYVAAAAEIENVNVFVSPSIPPMCHTIFTTTQLTPTKSTHLTPHHN